MKILSTHYHKNRVFVYSLLTICLLIIFSNNTKGIEDRNCLAYYQIPDSTIFNPDSVLIDTCDKSDKDEYQKLYAKYFFTMDFTYNVIPRNYIAPKDTIIEYSINDILSIYQLTRDGFTQLESIFGSFRFRDTRTNFPDTTKLIKRTLLIRFYDNVNIDSVEKFLKTITLVEWPSYNRNYGVISYVKENTYESPSLVTPNPANDIISIENINQSENFTLQNFIGEKIECHSYSIGNKSVINIGHLVPGIYFIITDKGIICKFIKI